MPSFFLWLLTIIQHAKLFSLAINHYPTCQAFSLAINKVLAQNICYNEIAGILAEASETRSHLHLSHFPHCIMGFIQFWKKMVDKEIKVDRQVHV